MDILTRSKWGATASLGPPMPLPAQGLHVHHSVTNPDNDMVYEATGDVAANMKEIERIGVSRFGRFSYSWCLHPSGWVGEGAINTIGAHTSGYNSTSFGICFIGNYQLITPTSAQIEAFRELRFELLRKGWLVNNHYVLPHRTRKSTACPGDNIIDVWNQLLVPYIPSQPPVPEQEEEENMNIIFRHRVNKQAIWLLGSKLISVTGETNVTSAESGGTQITWVDDDEYKAVIKAYGPVVTA